jgi:RimJ/RimL family protein N-acetyltransferase
MLQGEKLRLRALKLSDLQFINNWRNDLENKIMTQGYRLPVTELQDDNWLRAKMSNSNPNEIFFIVETLVDSLPIGLIQLTNIDYFSGTAVWGFILGDKNSRGKGYSIEAPSVLFEYAFNVLNLRKVYGYPIAFNEATLKMHEKIGGFIKEGILKRQYYLNGIYHDVLILSLFREDYKSLKSNSI